MNYLKEEWLGTSKNDILSALVIAISLIPQSIGFAIIAGVNPMVGIYTSIFLGIITAIFGGRIGMISTATGPIALVLAGIGNKGYGTEYVIMASILAGIIQIILAFIGIHKLLKYIPRPVIIGFFNSLGILILKSQFSTIAKGSISMYILIALSLGIIYLFPKINKMIPSTLITLIIVTIITIVFKINTPTLGDIGNLSTGIPLLSIPNVPLTFETFKILFPYSFSVAIIGIIEALIVSQILDDLNKNDSNKRKECMAQGFGNLITGFLGGMAGCAMIGQSVINFKAGGKKRLSSLMTGVFLFILVIILNKIIVIIPMAVLVAIIIVIAISTFDWNSIKRLNKVPKSDALIMIFTTITVLITNNLALGIGLGIILSIIIYVLKSSIIHVTKIKEENDTIKYLIKGNLFFASTTDFLNKFDLKVSNQNIIIDLTEAYITDESAVHTLDKIINRLTSKNNLVKIYDLYGNNIRIIENIGNESNLTLQK